MFERFAAACGVRQRWCVVQSLASRRFQSSALVPSTLGRKAAHKGGFRVSGGQMKWGIACCRDPPMYLGVIVDDASVAFDGCNPSSAHQRPINHRQETSWTYC